MTCPHSLHGLAPAGVRRFIRQLAAHICHRTFALGGVRFCMARRVDVLHAPLRTTTRPPHTRALLLLYYYCKSVQISAHINTVSGCKAFAVCAALLHSSNHAQQLRAAANQIGLSASKQSFRAAVFPAPLHHHVLLLGRRLQPCKQQAASSASRCCARQLRHHGELLLPFHELFLTTANFDSFASRSLRIA